MIAAAYEMWLFINVRGGGLDRWLLIEPGGRG